MACFGMEPGVSKEYVEVLACLRLSGLPHRDELVQMKVVSHGLVIES